VSDTDMETLVAGFTIPPQPKLMLDIEKVYPDIDKIALVVQRDQGVAAAVLRTVNSPFFGLKTHVHNIPQAVALLGLTKLMAVVNATLVRSMVQEPDIYRQLDIFWNATDETTFAATQLCNRTKIGNADQVLLTGLFHNCAVPLLLCRHANYFEIMGEATQQEDMPVGEYEDNLLGTNHAALGYFVAKAWKLPKPVCEVIRDHHDLGQIRSYLAQPELTSTQLMALLLAAQSITGETAAIAKGQIDAEWFFVADDVRYLLGLSESDFQDMSEDISEQILKNRGQ
jgi:HD-like signal output (HDOD) protein